LLSVHYAIGGHFRYGLCHPPIIAPSDDQRQAPLTERLRFSRRGHDYGNDVAFATAIGRCSDSVASGRLKSTFG
jgi:hypothetical protein